MNRSTRHRRLGALAAVAVSTAVAGAAFSAGPAAASSHREAPGIAGQPQVDTTDVYAFLSPDKAGTVTLLANWLPFSEPAGGPNFYAFDPEAHYDIAVDTNGNAKPDIVYRWDFETQVKNPGTFLYNTGPVTGLNDPDLNITQTYDLSVYKNGRWSVVARDLPVAPSNVGTASMPDYRTLRNQAVKKVGELNTFAGQADDPFFLDLRVFNLLYGGNLSEVGNDTLRGYDVNTVALRVPVEDLGGKDNVIGVWSETSKKDSTGQYRRVSRLGMPLVNEVVIPLKDKDRFNASRPQGDAQFLPYVTDPGLPKVIEKVYGIKAPAAPRNDLVQVFLTGVPGLNQPKNVVPGEMLRLKLSPVAGQTPSRLGVIGGDANGFPNGRRLADDVIDISLQVVEGELVGSPNDLGDGVDANDVPFESAFPYVALPQSGSTSVNSRPAAAVSPLKGGTEQGTAPGAGVTGGGSAATPGAIARTSATIPADDGSARSLLLAAGVLTLAAGAGGLVLTRRRRTVAASGASVAPVDLA